MRLAQQFAQDRQGRRFADVLRDTRILFPAILDFFNHPDQQRRLIEFFRTNDGHVTTRFRQAVGVVVRIIMESHGWKTTGRKGSLGVRVKGPTRTVTTGADHNTGGLALWFTRAERYELVAGSPYRSVEERAAEIERTTATTVLE